jgi:UDPglucose 6-dehydrogenase
VKVSYFGAGKLGLSFAVWDAHKGHDVTCVDVVPGIVDDINKGYSHIDEPHVQELLTSARENGKLRATLDGYEAVLNSDISFVIVPTPSKEDGAFSLEYAKKACELIGDAIYYKESYHLVVCISTIMPGDSRELIKVRGENIEHIGFCYAPELIRQGSIIKDYSNPDFLLIGESDKQAGDMLQAYYRSIVGDDVVVRRMSLESAELAKIGVNTAVVAKMAVANQLAWICHRIPGADARDVLGAIGTDSRIGNKYFGAGTWPGGPCFPRDNIALAFTADQYGLSAPIAKEADAFHYWQARYFVRDIMQLMPIYPNDSRTVLLLGMTYKPGVSILEESQALVLAGMLQEAGYEVLMHDPTVADSCVVEYSDGEWEVFKDYAQVPVTLDNFAKYVDVIVIVTAWPEYKAVLENVDLPDRLVYDIWGILDPSKVRADYIRFGEGDRLVYGRH